MNYWIWIFFKLRPHSFFWLWFFGLIRVIVVVIDEFNTSEWCAESEITAFLWLLVCLFESIKKDDFCLCVVSCRVVRWLCCGLILKYLAQNCLIGIVVESRRLPYWLLISTQSGRIRPILQLCSWLIDWLIGFVVVLSPVFSLDFILWFYVGVQVQYK